VLPTLQIALDPYLNGDDQRFDGLTDPQDPSQDLFSQDDPQDDGGIVDDYPDPDPMIQPDDFSHLG
jgi:hypothetical protein